MHRCPRFGCGSADVIAYDHKPPRKHPDRQAGCTAECTVTGLFCRNCRTVTVPRETSRDLERVAMTEQQIIDRARHLELILDVGDIVWTGGEPTLDGMPAEQWLDAQSMA